MVRYRHIKWAFSQRKAFTLVELLGFIERRPDRIIIKKPLVDFYNSLDRKQAFANAARRLSSFDTFIKMLSAHAAQRPTLKVLANEFREKMGAGWTDGTAAVHVKILLDWARQAGLVPQVLVKKRQTGRKKIEDA